MEATYVKPLDNDQPWLEWIHIGKKTYEGRLYKGDWTNVEPGDVIRFESTKSDDSGQISSLSVLVKVTELRRYKSFGEAFDELGSALIPILGITRKEVIEMYQRYFSEEETERYGVVAVGVTPV